MCQINRGKIIRDRLNKVDEEKGMADERIYLKK